MSAYALWGGLVLLSVLLIGAWWFVARRRDDAPGAVATAFIGGASALVALTVNHFISGAVERPRPFLHYSHAEVLLARSHDFSFPSDHAVIAGALVTGIWLLTRRLGVVAAVLALLLAFSRVYVGVHYPADVAAGLVLGIAIGVLCFVALRRPLERIARRAATSRLAPLVEVARAPHG